MEKKCPICGFLFNPENAHYCGNCGRNIDNHGNIWSIYNSSVYSIITHNRLSELKRYESLAKVSSSGKLHQKDGNKTGLFFSLIREPWPILLSIISVAVAIIIFCCR